MEYLLSLVPAEWRQHAPIAAGIAALGGLLLALGLIAGPAGSLGSIGGGGNTPTIPTTPVTTTPTTTTPPPSTSTELVVGDLGTVRINAVEASNGVTITVAGTASAQSFVTGRYSNGEAMDLFGGVHANGRFVLQSEPLAITSDTVQVRVGYTTCVGRDCGNGEAVTATATVPVNRL